VGFSRDAFTDTTYGRLLILKVAVFIGLVAIAAWSRRIAHRKDQDVRKLRWSVGGELIFGIAVLTITALLVNAQPARSALSLPFTKEFRDPTMLIDLIVDPAKTGPVEMHVYVLTPSGGNLFTRDVTAEMSLPGKGIAPIKIPLKRGGPNHFLACNGPPAQVGSTVTCSDKFSVPFSGKWNIVIRARRDEFNEVAVQTPIDIR
jgi:copper transport protein